LRRLKASSCMVNMSKSTCIPDYRKDLNIVFLSSRHKKITR
jgi:hypothetical protein